MSIRNTDEAYGVVARILHWVIGLSIIGMLCLGLYMDALPKDDLNRDALYGFHKAFGLVILFAVLLIRGYIPDPLVKVATNLLPLLPLFLIPASTGIIQYGDLLKDEWFPITVAISVSMIASVAVIPFVFLFFSKLFGKR